MPTTLDATRVARIDTTSQFSEVLDLPVHLRDAIWRVDSANLRLADSPRGLVVAGMGGSGVGGRLARAALGRRLARPMEVAQGYSLPAWVDEQATVLVSSYSGGTEEALACYDDATERGAQRAVATTGGPLAERARAHATPVIPLPGGFLPRATVGYSTVVALEVAALCGAAPRMRDEVEAAARLVERLGAEWGPSGPPDGAAKALAMRLDGTLPVFVGAELTSAVAYRWKCQFNENAKLPAFSSEVPEHDHNEICGWSAPDLRLAAVLLGADGLDERNARRMALTGRIASDSGASVAHVRAVGDSSLEQLMSLVLLGDLTSLYAAVLRGVDPAEIAMIDRLKAELSES